jgi:hypothetical protein
VIDDDPKPDLDGSKVRLTCACSRCGEIMELQIAIDKFGDRPVYKIFRCEACGAVDWIAT